MEDIKLREFKEADRQQVQLDVVQAVQLNPRLFQEKYLADHRAFEGRYVCADLYKEVFPQYAASNDTRMRYNAVVHNAAAVLSSQLFRDNLAEGVRGAANTVVFLTGIPGAGKTSHVAPYGSLPQEAAMIFEGQLSNPPSGLEKIQGAIQSGFKVEIVVVHALPENALNNTFKRFTEMGRGASVNVMSEIQGKLPHGLQAIRGAFGDAVGLRVVDVRDRSREPTVHRGWSSLDIIKSEGNHEDIKQRLVKELNAAYDGGKIGFDCYEQAHGRVTPIRDRSMGGADRAVTPSDDAGRIFSQASGQELKLVLKQQPELGVLLAALHKKGLPSAEIADVLQKSFAALQAQGVPTQMPSSQRAAQPLINAPSPKL